MWTEINANVKVGSWVRVSLSDAPEFEAEVLEIHEDDTEMGASFRVLPVARRAVWVTEHRLVSVRV